MKPAWVEEMKAMRSDTAKKEEGMVAPWRRAAAGVTAEGERGPDGVVRGSDEDMMWEEWRGGEDTLPETWETEEDIMDGVPQVSLTEEERERAEMMLEEMERETTLRPPEEGDQPPDEEGGRPPEEEGGQPPNAEGGPTPNGEGGPPPNGEGGPTPGGEGGPPPDGDSREEARVIALREGDWANALKLVQKVLTERGQAEGIFGRDLDRVEPGDSPLARATDEHCGNGVMGRLTLWTGGKVDVDLGGEEMNETALNCFAYSYGEQWNTDFSEDKTNQEQWKAMIALIRWRIVKYADLTGIMELIQAMWTRSNDGHGGVCV